MDNGPLLKLQPSILSDPDHGLSTTKNEFQSIELQIEHYSINLFQLKIQHRTNFKHLDIIKMSVFESDFNSLW